MARIKQSCGCVVATGKDLPVYCDTHRPRQVFNPRYPDPSAARIAELETDLESWKRQADAENAAHADTLQIVRESAENLGITNPKEWQTLPAKIAELEKRVRELEGVLAEARPWVESPHITRIDTAEGITGRNTVTDKIDALLPALKK